jgi:hypothetical protein
MKVRTISVTFGKTVQPKPFESIRVEVTMSADLEDGDDLEAEYASLLSNVRVKVKSEIVRQMP